MRSLFRRMLCALLCLCLLTPALSLAEQDVTGVRFDLRFQMDPSVFPQEQQALACGIADLVNILSLQGTLAQSFNGCFDLNLALMLADAAETRTTLRLFGTESQWSVASSLLGEETLFINLIAMLEFALKIYYHMDIPLQRAAVFISPYVHTSALDALRRAWNDVMLAQQGDRRISRDDALALASELAEIAENDRTFRVWVQALALEAGYDEATMEAFAFLPEWAESILAEDGISISTQGTTETWQTGEYTLFTRTVEDSVTAWSVVLPEPINGYNASVFYNGQPNGEHILRIDISDEYEDAVLDCTVKAENIPDLTCEVPVSAPFSLSVDLSGVFLEEDLHLLFQGEGEDGYVALSMIDTRTGAPQLTVSGMLEAFSPDTVPDYTSAELTRGMNLLSMNDEGLTRLVSSVTRPLLKGMIPLLAHAPASSVQSILDLMTDSGIINMLVNGGASIDEEEYFD